MIAGLAAGLAAALLFGASAVLQAHAVRRLPGGRDLAHFVLAAVRNGWLMVVVAAYLLGFLLHAVSIWLLPLYLAQATISMSMPVTALLSALVLRETVGVRRWVAIAAVTGGLVLLAAGSGAVGALHTSGWFALALWAVALAVGVLGLLLREASGATLGWLAGLAYSGSAVAVRGVDLALTPATVASALAVPVFGLLGFWLYSLGLERAIVSSSTAPMIVAQTFVPALLGLWLLGDAVRDGWAVAVLTGLVLATVGAIRVGRASPGDGAPSDSSGGSAKMAS
ncbi:hypothetical protein [Nocardioides pacificus]